MKTTDDLTAQNDEIETLTSIYEKNLTILPSNNADDGSKSFEIKVDQTTIHVDLPMDYPSKSLPNYDIFAPFLKKDDKDYLEFQLKEALNSAKGMPVVFALVECVKEFVKGKTPSSQETNTVLPDLNEADD